MKKSIVKRFISILLVLVMICCCCISAGAYQEGVDKVQIHKWGIEVYISKTSITHSGELISICSYLIPEKIVATVLGISGVIESQCPGGIVLEYDYSMIASQLLLTKTLSLPKKFRWQ